MKTFFTVLIALASTAAMAANSVPELCGQYLEVYFKTFPTRATEAGRHDFDEQLEELSPDNRAKWVEFNRLVKVQIAERLQNGKLSLDDQLDAEALLGQIERELNEQELLRRPECDPLYWSSIVANAMVFLLVRDDLPVTERQRRARARAEKLPRLLGEARQMFTRADPKQIAPQFCQIAAGQLRASSTFYRDGFPGAVGAKAPEGKLAADALADLANFFDELAKRASGSPRLGAAYAATFRAGTRVDESITELLARAQADLAAKRAEAAAYGREVWKEIVPGDSAPSDDTALLRALFERVASDRDRDTDEYFAHWQENVKAIETFVREKKIITLPDPLTLIVDRSPSFFVGQSVGGVYPAGPYSPDARTILFLPMPAVDASAEDRTAFFRDFNRHFNQMIVPHELIPGHYVQLKIAAHQPHKIRAVFPDPVYVEGWGTFCERLLLDQGWGGPRERLAHLKKQLENIARTVVDIRVHTQNMSRDEVVRFVKEEAMQDDQFASNMWTRSITTSPQITTYYLGYAKVRDVYERVRAAEGANFDLHRFMDAMMELGPVKLDHYLTKLRQPRSDGPG